ncbi:TetR/AcrR family transcriptional regulator [Gordonia sp. LSe1-13]|uniref:TetR/AcrR family transcriptional regulator n=1 Tax=Gordonia sesuvii TaxID=3116777 RepID=A0ABU7MJ43_9ACTN|nr:TetR/AcrR family transcriptional regulator [Gordonia sp. LSe1-13]
MSRPYRKLPPQIRAADRRAKLISAGVELVGTQGVSAMTMRAVCREAGLSQKFFYESFADTDALLHEVYNGTLRRVRDLVDEAATGGEGDWVRRRAGVDAAARLVAEDPRVCRILFVEPVADVRLRRYVRRSILALISADSDRSAVENGVTVASKLRYATLFGSLISLFIEWSEGNLGTDRAVFVDHVMAQLERLPGAGHVVVADEPVRQV